MISLSDNEAWRRLRLTPLLSSSKFPTFSALKCLQNSSIIQNNSGVSLNEVKNFVTGSHIKNFCNCLIFTVKVQNICKTTNFFTDYFLSRTEVILFISFGIWVRTEVFPLAIRAIINDLLEILRKKRLLFLQVLSI